MEGQSEAGSDNDKALDLSNLFAASTIHQDEHYSCDKCSKRFKQKSLLEHHTDTYHAKTSSSEARQRNDGTGKKVCICIKCSKNFSTQAKLITHMRLHTKIKIQTLICAKCGKRLVSAKSLKEHEKAHTRTNSFVCYQCGKVFIQPSQLEDHMKIHTGEKNFACKDCGKRFMWNYQLKIHVRMHVRQNQVDEKLNASEKSVENSVVLIKEETMFSCQKCGKGFCDFSMLDTHKLCHAASQLQPKVPAEGCESRNLPGEEEHNAESQSESANSSMTEDRVPPSSQSDSGQEQPTFHKWADFLSFVGLASVMQHQSDENSSVSSSVEMPETSSERIMISSHPESTLQTQTNTESHIQDDATESMNRQIERRENFDCRECGKHLMSAASLRMHTKIHTGEKPHFCPKCNKRFLHHNSLKLHLRIHNGEKPCVCTYCGKRFSHPSNLIQHVRIHTGDRRYECRECGRFFVQGSQLKTHMKVHTGERPHACSECGKRFACRSSLTSHIKKHEENLNVETPHLLNFQHEEKSDVLLGTPLEVQTAKILQSFAQRNANFALDLTNRKGQETCLVQNSASGSSRSGPNHENEPLNNGIDDDSLGRFEMVMATQRKLSTGVEGHTCLDCGRAYTNVASLNEHVKIHHKEKSFQTCVECGKIFTQLGGLKLHMRTHTGEKPCICNYCNKCFATPGNLQQHLRTHTGEKPFCCSECGRGFAQRSQLKTHMKVHTGEKPFACGECGKSFGYYVSLKAHLKVHDEEKTPSNEDRISSSCFSARISQDAQEFEERFRTEQIVSQVIPGETDTPRELGISSSCFSARISQDAHESEERLRTEQIASQVLAGVTDIPRELRISSSCFSARISQDAAESQERLKTGQVLSDEANTHRVLRSTEERVSHENFAPDETQNDIEQTSKISSDRRKQKRPRKIHDEDELYSPDEEDVKGETPISNTIRNNLKARYVKMENGVKVHTCPDCGKNFTQSTNLMLHMRIHSGEKPHVCTYCPKRFANPSNLIQHLRTHTGEKPYGCTKCTKHFAQRSQLKTHMKTHTKEKPFACEECGKRFGYAISLKAHAKSHARKKLNPMWRVSPSLQLDDISEHDKETEAVKTKTQQMLSEMHSNGPPFTCLQCQKNFVNQNSLKLHLRIHSGEKPCVCHYCNKRFSHPSNLIQHVRIHTGEKPYGCDKCGKRFVQSTQLKTHMKVHTKGRRRGDEGIFHPLQDS